MKNLIAASLLLLNLSWSNASELYINRQLMPPLSNSEYQDYQTIRRSLIDKNQNEFFYTVKEIIKNGTHIKLSDGSIWKVGWIYTFFVGTWEVGQHIKIYFKGNANAEITNCELNSTITCELSSLDDWKGNYIKAISKSEDKSYDVVITLTSGHRFGVYDRAKISEWELEDAVYIFHGKEKNYDICNFQRKTVFRNLPLISFFEEDEDECELTYEKVTGLVDLLDKRVIGQHQAAESVVAALANYAAGLKDQNAPIGSFLFLGPTGVGKTELAKGLATEVFGDEKKLIRFDMSQFTEHHHTDKLFGSPPGYVNHDEGGQLTNAVKERSHSVVLFDEIEKAHDKVRKSLLPTLDEGYAYDNKNNLVDCRNVIFIMTSNLCYEKIVELHSRGYDTEEILYSIEQCLIKELSPEFYNRLEAIVFSPITREMMDAILDKMLTLVVKRAEEQTQITLIIDESVREYLLQHGFQPKLGARPLKRLIEKRVVGTLSFAIVKEKIPPQSVATLLYDKSDNSWHVEWTH